MKAGTMKRVFILVAAAALTLFACGTVQEVGTGWEGGVDCKGNVIYSNPPGATLGDDGRLHWPDSDETPYPERPDDCDQDTTIPEDTTPEDTTTTEATEDTTTTTELQYSTGDANIAIDCNGNYNVTTNPGGGVFTEVTHYQANGVWNVTGFVNWPGTELFPLHIGAYSVDCNVPVTTTATTLPIPATPTTVGTTPTTVPATVPVTQPEPYCVAHPGAPGCTEEGLNTADAG
jgi:hypothetical protein